MTCPRSLDLIAKATICLMAIPALLLWMPQ